MGGNLAWTLRLEDGTEYRMDRWTNAMPELITNAAFLRGEPAAIEAALDSWLAMKADWEANKDNGTFKLPMTEVYAPYPYGMQPSEYGLVVTDFVTKTILSLQGYTNLGQINAVRQAFGPSAAQTFPSKVAQLETWARDGRVKSYEFLLRSEKAAQRLADLGGEVSTHPHGDAWIALIPGSVDLETLTARCDEVRADIPPHPQAAEIAAMRAEAGDAPPEGSDAAKALLIADGLERGHAMDHDPFIFAQAHPDLAPFTLEEFDEDADGYEALRARILELGFMLDNEEEAAWSARISEQREREAEDA